MAFVGRSPPMNVRLYILQRATAVVMVPLVLAHLVVIFYATSRGLSAAEILGRTRGSIGWGAFYALFVLAAATHGAIGVRVVASEWTGLRGRRLDILMWGVGLVLAGAGPQSRRRGGAVMRRRTRQHIGGHRHNALWMAAMVHRISGLALACFLPLHFLALGSPSTERRGSTAS